VGRSRARRHRTYGEDGVAAVAVHVAELLSGGRREVVQREGGRRRGRGRHHDRFRRPSAAAPAPEALALSRSTGESRTGDEYGLARSGG
jgi:hypothetical protein